MSGQNFASTTARQARKRHVCEECFRSINPGETYYRTAGSWEGDFFTNRACGHCNVFRKYIGAADDNYHDGYFGGAGEWVANGYFGAYDLPGMTWVQRLGLYRMAKHFRDKWRDRNGNLRPLPSYDGSPSPAAPTPTGNKQ